MTSAAFPVIPPHRVTRLTAALPFWLSLGLLPLAWFAATRGGLWVAAVPLAAWGLFTVLDALTGLNETNPDPATPEAGLIWYCLVTLIWFPLQFATQFGLIWYTLHAPHLSVAENLGLFFGIGVISGTVGITYAHELMHQKNRAERWLGDLLLASVLYSHFRTEHMKVHHVHVGTRADAVTARLGEGFLRFYPRVLRQSLVSAWRTEAAFLARKGLTRWHRSNPFWRYWALQAGMIALALTLGGWRGLGLFALQAGVAVWQLELVNYVEHYGLTRKHLDGGKYEPVRPHHSWNAAHRASNWLLINLQRHSDHHVKPDRRFPLLQTYPEAQAPQLPFGYPVMTVLAMIPPLWRARMNPRVRAWRRQWYPEITDWAPYDRGELPLPRGA